MDLRNVPAFAGLNDTQLENFKAAMRPAEVSAGSTVFEKGRAASDMYFFGEGKLRVTVEGQTLAEITAPCVVGELELLAGGDPVATVTAVDTCKGFAIAYVDLRQRLGDGDPAALKVAYNISRVMARRLTAMDQKVVDMLGGKWETAKKDLQDLRAKLFGEWA